MNLTLTPVMLDFVRQQVREGRALDVDEYIRFLVCQEIKYWEKVNRRAWPVPNDIKR